MAAAPTPAAPAPYQSSQEASSGLTAAFQPSTPEQAQAIAKAASLVPSRQASPIPSTPTVLSSKDLAGGFTTNSAALAAKTAPTSAPTPTPTPATGPSSGPTDSPTATKPSVDTNGTVTTGNPLYDMIQQSGAQQQAQLETDAAQKKQDAQNLLQTNLAANDATYAAQIGQVQATYSSLIDAQTRLNSLNLARTKAYGLASGNAMATPLEYTGAVSNETQAGMDAIKKLDNERDALIATAQAAQKNGDAKLLSDNMDKINQIEADMKTQAVALQKQLQDAYTGAQKAITDQQAQMQQQAQQYMAAASLRYLDTFQNGDDTQKAAIIQQITQESGGLVNPATAYSSLQSAAADKMKAAQDAANLDKTYAGDSVSTRHDCQDRC